MIESAWWRRPCRFAASGTEPVIRVMVEGKGETATRAAAIELAEVVKAAAEV